MWNTINPVENKIKEISAQKYRDEQIAQELETPWI
jgi:hypothetical protein